MRDLNLQVNTTYTYVVTMETSQQQLSKAEHSVVSSGTTTSEDRTQEQVLKAKYGGLLPKKKLMPRDQK